MHELPILGSMDEGRHSAGLLALSPFCIAIETQTEDIKQVLVGGGNLKRLHMKQSSDDKKKN